MRKYKIEEKLNIERKKCFKCLVLLMAILCLSLTTTTVQAAAKNTFVTKAGKTYYYNTKGKKVKGLKKIKKKYYYFNKKGVMKTGWRTIKGKRYYFHKKKGYAYTGVKKISKKYYYFNKKGVMKTGWRTVNGKRYYFHKTKGYAYTGLKKINSKYYYFNNKGVMQKNVWKTVNGSRYYFGSNGAAYTGTKTINGVTYQFNSNGKFVKKVTTTGTSSTTGSGSTGTTDTGSTGSGSTGSGSTTTDAATLFDSWEVEAAIDRFDYKQQRFSENGLTLTTAAKTVVSTLNSKKSSYQDMINNYSKYTTSQINSAVSEIDNMTSQLKVNVELVYYPEHSKAIFDAINEYRNSLGLSSLTWSENLSTVARYECGYYCYTYPDGNYLNEHAASQLSVCSFVGTFPVSQALESWQNSSMHDPTLRNTNSTHGAVAYYTCNNEDGAIWSKAIFAHGISTSVGYHHCPDDYKSLVLNCKTSSKSNP